MSLIRASKIPLLGGVAREARRGGFNPGQKYLAILDNSVSRRHSIKGMEVRTADIERAPCLEAGPIAANARAAVAAARALGQTPMASILRAWCVPYLFHEMERAFAADEDPVAAINRRLAHLAQVLTAAHEGGFASFMAGAEAGDGAADAVEAVTGEHYGWLFKAFSSKSFFDEPLHLLRTRLERNDIDLAGLEEKTVLDAGCGGGRYTVAWRLLGARAVVGVDISEVGLADARARVVAAEVEGVRFVQSNVLTLPFGDDAFDVVFSNGVLHHTLDWRQGVEELVRVLKPGGMGWLYLIENHGGLFWDVIEILRVITHGEPRDLARATLHLMGLPANRVFYMLDHVMVPINVRLTPDEIRTALADAGATGIRRLTRGTDFDRVEQIYQGRPHAETKYGVGENRFIFTKEA